MLQRFIDSPEAITRTWKGYKILARNGTEIEIPQIKETYDEFHLEWTAEKNKRASRVMVSCIVDVLNEFILDTEIEYADTSEETLLRYNIENMTQKMNIGKIILILDRGYPSIELLQLLEEKNIKYIIRLPKSYYKKEREERKTDDENVTLKITQERLNNLKPETQEYIKTRPEPKARIINAPLENGMLTVVTNLDKKMLTKEELPEMYHKRWKIETACRNLKNHECIENFSGKKRITILQDIFAGVYLYNLVTALESDAEEERNWEVKASLKTNMNTTMGMVKKYFFQFILETNP